MKIKTFEYKRIEVSEFEVPIPQETTYYFETGVRRSVRIVPKWTSWNKERYGKDEYIFELEVTCVYLSTECKIEKFDIAISRIEDIYNSKENSISKQIITNLVNDWFDKRTQEQFQADLNSAIREIVNPPETL